jgi:hypothetical protein
MIGGDVQCGNCQAVFVAREGRPSGRTSPPSRRPADEDRPSRRPRRDEDEDEVEERPSRRSRRRDDYDDEQRPRKRGEGQGMATASMVIGIIAATLALFAVVTTLFGAACCACFIPVAWVVYSIAGIGAVVGLILGILSLKSPGRSKALTGVITSAAALLLGVVGVILTILGFALIGAAAANNPGINQPNNPPFNQPVRPNPRR